MAAVRDPVIYANVNILVSVWVVIREDHYLQNNSAINWVESKRAFYYYLYIDDGSIADTVFTWGVENGYFRIENFHTRGKFFNGGRTYKVFMTKKFYFDFVLPEIVKRRNENWLPILIKDTVGREL